MRPYRYVGPKEIRHRKRGPAGTVIRSAADLEEWARARDRLPDDTVPATFVIDTDGRMRVADRRSEHVDCADGGDVQSAGELFFLIDGGAVEVAGVTNQSTGYCPEPESWPAVAAALDGADIPHPGGFTKEFVFRRCEACGQRNVVKESVFECGACGRPLSAAWNFDR
jgi:hypothetical protein